MTENRKRDPLHGVTLAMILEKLVDNYGWEALGRAIPIRCFNFDPSIKSSLTFLRKTPWARAKVESLYVECLDELDAIDNDNLAE
ncbi:MAG: VF530 family protein [Planctomycetaceae bacterium]